jgi:diketogulonate reductase-like aldo/keto reductase
MSEVPTIMLNNGRTIPQLGFGVFQVPDADTAGAVRHALDAGYRSIDTAALYRNERSVGRAVAESGIPRDELFITTKVWNTDQGYDSTLRAFDKSLGKLAMDYVDLYLIHWPTPARGLYVETWTALEKLLADGRTRAIGVSNFQPEHLRRLFDASDVVPAVNQIELHPELQQTELREFHARHGIVTEAWSPLARGALLDHPALAALAKNHGRTPAQVILRWQIQLGNVAIPRSVTPSRIRENIETFDFTLGDEDLATIGGLDRNGRVGPHPDTFNR